MSFRSMRVALIAVAVIAITSSDEAMATDAHVDLFAQQPVMSVPQLSPDGRRIAFLSSLKGRYHLVIEQFKPSFDRIILKPEDNRLDFEWVKWANNERLVLTASYSASRWNVETMETRLYSIAANGQDLKAIIRPGSRMETGSRLPKEMLPPQLQHNVINWLVDAPDHILVSVDSDFDGCNEVRRVDITDGSFKIVRDDFLGCREWITDQTGEVLVGWGYADEDKTVVIKNAAGEWTRKKKDEWLAAGFSPVAFTEDSNVLLTQGPGDAGISVVRKLDLRTLKFAGTVFEHDRYDADDVIIDHPSGMPVGVSYTEHFPVVHYFDPEMKIFQATLDKAVPGQSNKIINTSKDRRQILFLARSDTSPGAYYIWDRDAKSISRYSDYIANLSVEQLSPIQAIEYTATDGMVIPSYLTIPRGARSKNLPAVILPHGGPGSRSDKRYWFLNQFLASRGYAVLQPNFRGSSGYGKSFEQAGLRQWGGKMQDDLSDGAQWLIDEGIADPERLCIVGWSYGGYAAAMGAVKTPDLFRCAASINGVMNLPVHLTDERKYLGGKEWTKQIGLDGEKSKTVSPYHQAKNIKVPMLIIQSADDTRVHAEQGRGMAKRLRKLGKEVEYVEIDFGGHLMRNVDGRKRILESLDSFLGQYIGDGA